MNSIIGQTKIIKNLLPQINKAAIYSKPLEHTLFFGQPGLGKTTLVEIIGRQLCTTLIQKTGRELKIDDVKNILKNICYRNIFFIDEIHRVKSDVLEILYSPLQIITNFQKQFIKTNKFPKQYLWENNLMNAFTLIGATTSAGMLLKPLRDRFIHSFEFQLYSIKELCEILQDNGCPPNCANLIAERSRGVPRLAINLLINIHNQGLYIDEIKPRHCLKTFKELGIDINGLNESDIKILKYLALNGESGEQNLSFSLDIDKEDLVYIHEPYLMKLGLIKRTSKGRILTKKGEEYL